MNWVNLPNSQRHVSSNPHRADDIRRLRDNPGVWAELSVHANPKAARQVVLRLRMRHNGSKYDTGGPYEFTSRVYRPPGHSDGHPPKGMVYGRWVGNLRVGVDGPE